MESKEEQLLNEFFDNAKTAIEDKDFTEKVLRQLPRKKSNTAWIVPAFTLLGLVLTALLIDVQWMIRQLFDVLSAIPLTGLIGGFMTFPLLVLLAYFLSERRDL